MLERLAQISTPQTTEKGQVDSYLKLPEIRQKYQEFSSQPTEGISSLLVTPFLWWHHWSVLAGCLSPLLCSVWSGVLATLPAKDLQGAGWRRLLQGRQIFTSSVFHSPLKLSDPLVSAFVFSTPVHVPEIPAAMAEAEGSGGKVWLRDQSSIRGEWFTYFEPV